VHFIHFHHLLHQYGYLALFIGCLLEGETLLIIAGFAAHQGDLSFPWVVVLAAVAGTLGDQFFFFLGRYFSAHVLPRLSHSEEKIERVNRMLLRHYRGLIVGVRFMYGLRIAGPVIIGASKVPASSFVLFNVLGASIWAVLLGGAGYLFGRTMEHLFFHFKRFEFAAVILCALVVLGIAIWHRCREN